MQFICTSKQIKGKRVKRALYYMPAVGRGRIYRSGFNQPDNGFKLLTYKSKKYAQGICNVINQKANDDFKVEELV